MQVGFWSPRGCWTCSSVPLTLLSTTTCMHCLVLHLSVVMEPQLLQDTASSRWQDTDLSSPLGSLLWLHLWLLLSTTKSKNTNYSFQLQCDSSQTSANSYCIDTVVGQCNPVKSESFIDLFCALEHLDWPLGGVFVNYNNNDNTLSRGLSMYARTLHNE